MTPQALLAQAIRERRVVEFAYHGEARAVEPYALGEVAGALPEREHEAVGAAAEYYG